MRFHPTPSFYYTLAQFGQDEGLPIFLLFFYVCPHGVSYFKSSQGQNCMSEDKQKFCEIIPHPHAVTNQFICLFDELCEGQNSLGS